MAGRKRAAEDEHSAAEKRSRTDEGAAVTKRAVGRPRKSVVPSATSAASTRRSVAGLPSSRRPRNSLAPNGVLERTMRLSILPLPKAPQQHTRPAKTLLVFGCGDSGEFGMGPEEESKGEIGRPRLHQW
ncbi:hypothetical protein QFC19_003733 [Naganishia cerealis]|uniref:Uncharacterized protein n=1 Tax=Naganishia cerealis TaxID=610337 RepID=A0ACC2W0G9_9TREE|nr:hypothetical protein QFC19_003733 [Naganishia cerealis]